LSEKNTKKAKHLGQGHVFPPLFWHKTTVCDWHRIGFAQNGIERIPYGDDIEVASNAAENLKSASGGLNIGTGNAMEPGTYWSGLIDDVRIYNRAVRP